MKLGITDANGCLRVAGWFAALWIVLFAASLLTSCASVPKPTPASALKALEDTCAHYPNAFLEQTKEGDAACAALKKTKETCAEWQELNAAPPAYGNKVVLDGGAGGAEGE
jgi:hypothetical protein